MQSDVITKLPVRIKVQEVLSSRYEGQHHRPANWDRRKSGVDVVKTTDGQTIKLQSDGGQSPPQKDWVVLLSKGDAQSGYIWTLYGM